MRFWVNLSFLALLSLSSLGTTLVYAEPKRILEKELADRLAYYQSISTLEVQFKQVKTLSDLKLKLNSEGRLQLIRPDRVIWEVRKPSRVWVSLDQKDMIIESGEGPQLSRQKIQLSQIPDDRGAQSLKGLVAWLQLDAHLLSQQYEIETSGPRTFLFTPKDPSHSVFRNLEMSLAPSGHLKTLTIHESSGDQMEISFGQPKITRNPMK